MTPPREKASAIPEVEDQENSTLLSVAAQPPILQSGQQIVTKESVRTSVAFRRSSTFVVGWGALPIIAVLAIISLTVLEAAVEH